MLSKVPFYNSITRKLVIAFGGLFGSIYVVNKDAANTTRKIVKVPIAFANKDKMTVRLQQDPGLNQDVEILLPRLSFEVMGYQYDGSRQLNKTNRTIGVRGNDTVKTFAPVPYNVAFNLYSFTRTMEDNLQIMEQILPYFTPDLNISIKMVREPEVIQDVPLILNDVVMDDQYDGGFEDRRYIITTYSFTMKTYYYGAAMGTTDPDNHFESGDAMSVIKKVDVDVNGARRYTAQIDPFDANTGDVYTIPESWTDI